MKTNPEVHQLLNARADSILSWLPILRQALREPRAGSLDEEIGQQRAKTWNRAATPLESGFHSASHRVAAACSQVETFIGTIDGPCHISTGDVLVRAALENLSVAHWLLEEPQASEERSIRALSEANASTEELKKLYRDEGRQINTPALSDAGESVRRALADIQADADTALGAPAKLRMPTQTKLIELLYGEAIADGSGFKHAPIYRFLSPTAHGTRWAMTHYASAQDADGRVSMEPTAEHSERLLFYLGIAFIKVWGLGSIRLDWPEPDQAVREFYSLGPCVEDFGSLVEP